MPKVVVCPVIFKSIYLLGAGTIASALLTHLAIHKGVVCALLYREPKLSTFGYLAEKNGYACQRIDCPHALKSFLSGLEQPSLVISANNLYLFPPSVVDNPNIQIMNFHNSLLPKHMGVNAPSWAIFDQDATTGITWHWVTKEVDRGNILGQKEIPLCGTENALTLAQKLMQVGADLFAELVTPLLAGQLASSPMRVLGERQMHLQRDVPNDGLLDMAWSGGKMYAFLRAMDWGRAGLFPAPRLVLHGLEYTISKYRVRLTSVTTEPHILAVGNTVHIAKDGHDFMLHLSPFCPC